MPEEPKKRKKKYIRTAPLILNPRQKIFCEEYVRTGNGIQAAKAAGYHRQERANQLLRDSPPVKEYINNVKKELVKQGVYDVKQAMKEAEDAIEFAKKTENANAYVKAVELRSKLNGLLVEKVDHRVSGFVLQIGGPPPSQAPALPEIKDVVSETTNEEEDLISE